jgi:hypothetical protein
MTKNNFFKIYQLSSFSVIKLDGLFFVTTPAPGVSTLQLASSKYYQTTRTILKKSLVSGTSSVNTKAKLEQILL